MGKDKYKVRNWSAYNEGLKRRGAINIWISSDAFDAPAASSAIRRGRPLCYSDALILTCLVVRKIYHLPLRACQGFLQSLVLPLQLNSPIPDYTTVCRRAATLQVALCALERLGICDIAIDSTGLKVYGEGEWKVRRHGFSKYRTWRKLHVVVNTENGQLEALTLTPNSTDDAAVAVPLVEEVLRQHPVGQLLGDGAYDKKKVREPLQGRCPQMVFPPSVRAVKSKEEAPWQAARNEMLEQIERVGRKQWKQAAGYHKRSIAETVMFRYKTIIGPCLQSRKTGQQLTEARISGRILNQMLQLAKPVSYKVS